MQRELLACDAGALGDLKEEAEEEEEEKKKTLSGSFVVIASFKLKAKQTPRYVYRY